MQKDKFRAREKNFQVKRVLPSKIRKRYPPTRRLRLIMHRSENSTHCIGMGGRNGLQSSAIQAVISILYGQPTWLGSASSLYKVPSHCINDPRSRFSTAGNAT